VFTFCKINITSKQNLEFWLKWIYIYPMQYYNLINMFMTIRKCIIYFLLYSKDAFTNVAI
jgi:hypothetical protein